MAEKLNGTVALVTGASSGIGEATARSLVEQGASVAVAARRIERLDRLVQSIREKGGKGLAIQADVTQREQATAAIERTVAEFGRLDTVINNAGVMLLGPIVGAPIEEWERMVSLNVMGMLYIAHAALPHLLRAAQDSPRRLSDLVFISSVAGRVARNGAGAYNLTKFGINAFAESLRQEVTARHLRVSLVEPGLVRTELEDHLRPEIRAQRQPLEKIEHLISQDISDAITYIVTRPWRVSINEILIRPTEQEW